jgi:hypothetical protein
VTATLWRLTNERQPKESDMMLKEIFPKGKTVKSEDLGWYAIVIEAPRKKVDNGYATMMVEVFGFEHESGSAYVRDYKPVPVAEFMAATAGKVPYFAGKLI